MEKKIYESPVIEVVEFAVEDIITTSGETSITPGENELPVVRAIYTQE